VGIFGKCRYMIMGILLLLMRLAGRQPRARIGTGGGWGAAG
jgi:hypothetical protein